MLPSIRSGDRLRAGMARNACEKLHDRGLFESLLLLTCPDFHKWNSLLNNKQLLLSASLLSLEIKRELWCDSGSNQMSAINCCELQLSNKDLESRRSTQKVDPVTGEIYIKDIYDPEKPKPKKEVQYWCFRDKCYIFVCCSCFEVIKMWKSWLPVYSLLDQRKYTSWYTAISMSLVLQHLLASMHHADRIIHCCSVFR